jgi:hypothetical protein
MNLKIRALFHSKLSFHHVRARGRCLCHEVGGLGEQNWC